MWIVPLLVYGWQSQPQPDPIRSGQYVHMRNAAVARHHEVQQKKHAKHHRQEFEERFNKLVLALETFVEEYRRGEGHAWPADKAGAVKEAFNELQKTHAWKTSTNSEK